VTLYENYDDHWYPQSVVGYLETTFSSFDARGNPQTVTDPCSGS
jgi:hypothetical protein